MFRVGPHFCELQRFQNDKIRDPFKNRKNRNVNSNVINNNPSANKSLRYRENFHQYMEDTTLHGLKYVGDRSLSPVERIFFALSCLVVLILSIYFISNAYIKWSASPVITSQKVKATSITDIPFPAVTICNINAVRKSAIKSFPGHSVEYSLAESICSEDDNATSDIAKTSTWQQFRDVLINVSQPCKEMLVACEFGSVDYDCSDLFNSILTDGGLCCIFNGIHTHFLMKHGHNHFVELDSHDDYLTGRAIDWNPEYGFSVKKAAKTEFTYPRTSIDASKLLGLRVVLNVDAKEYYCVSQPSYGFNVLLHSPIAYPTMKHFGMAIGSGFETNMQFTPVLTEASDDVRHLSPSVRRCYFQNENFLEFYRTYTRQNCKMECAANNVRRHCGCVPFFLPRADDSDRICKIADRACIDELMSEVTLKSKNSLLCGNSCFPGCFSTDYDSHISATPLMANLSYLRKLNLSTEDAAILRISTKIKYFQAQRIEEFVSFTDFLSDVGGLLGLFMGFSFVSIVELIYFMALRPYYIHVRYYQSHREGIRRIIRKTPTCLGFKKKKMKKTQVMAVSDNRFYP